MFGVILLPNFALQTVLRHQPEIRLGSAVALLGDDAGAKTVILQCNAAARNAGVAGRHDFQPGPGPVR